jgi:hypothetical protein
MGDIHRGPRTQKGHGGGRFQNKKRKEKKQSRASQPNETKTEKTNSRPKGEEKNSKESSEYRITQQASLSLDRRKQTVE